MEEKELQVVSFVNDGVKGKRKNGVFAPIIAKVVFLVFMITVATILVSTGNIIGYVLYAKEIIEFIIFAVYVRGSE